MNTGIWKKQKCVINGINNKKKDEGETLKLGINFRRRKAQTESLKSTLRNIFIYHLINPSYPALPSICYFITLNVILC